MLRRIIILQLASMIVVMTNAQTGNVWTLEGCINHAIECNTNVRKQSLGAAKARIALQEGKWAFVPSLSISSNYTTSTGRVLDPTTYQFVQTSLTGSGGSSISADINLFEGGKKIYTLDKAKLSLRASLLKEESVKYDLKLNVTAAYMDVLCSREQIKIAEESETLVKGQLERSKRLLEAGGITESEVLQLQSQHFAAINDVSKAKHSELMARLTLCDLLEIDDYSSFSVTPQGICNESYETFNIESVIENSPDYQAVLLSQSLAQSDLGIARSILYPKISLSVGYGSSFSDARKKSVLTPNGVIKYEAYSFIQQYTDNSSAYISIGLKIPILSGLANHNGVKRAKIAASEARISTLEVRKELRKRILQARFDCQDAKDRYHRAEEEVRYAEEAQRQINEKYNLGATDYLSWNTALIELARAKYSLIESKYRWYLKTEILRLYVFPESQKVKTE